VLIGDCTDEPPFADDEGVCVQTRNELDDGDIEVTILTVHASGWNFGAALPRLRIGNVKKPEGNGGTKAFVLTISRRGGRGRSSSVQVNTGSREAKSGKDFIGQSGTMVTFAAGDASEAITVLVRGDRRKENDERFVVRLSNPTGATIADGLGIATIVNDDHPPRPAPEGRCSAGGRRSWWNPPSVGSGPCRR
jgi:chitinase